MKLYNIIFLTVSGIRNKEMFKLYFAKISNCYPIICDKNFYYHNSLLIYIIIWQKLYMIMCEIYYVICYVAIILILNF